MEIVTVKIISLTVVLLISLITGLLPMIVVRSPHGRQRGRKRFLSFLSCYGGGVFLGASLLDLLPDVQEDFSEVLKELNIDTKFPIVEFVVAIGFFIVFIIEQIVLAWKERATLVHNHHSHEREHLVQAEGPRPIAYNSIDSGPLESSLAQEHDHSFLFSVHEDPSSHSNLRTIMLLLALSLHSIFEGLAIGLQSVVDHLFQILTAILIHKGIITLSLGVNLAQSRFTLKLKLISVLIFSCASPIGIAIGIILTDTTENSGLGLTCAVLQGIACGTFLYIPFFEVLPHEMNDKTDRLLKLLFVIIGFATICLAIYFDISLK